MKINCFSVNKVKITQEFFYQVPWKPGQCAQVSKLDVLTLVYFKYMDFIQLESAELRFKPQSADIYFLAQ